MPGFFLLPLAVFAALSWTAIRSRLALEDLLDRYARQPEARAGGPRPIGWNRTYRCGPLIRQWLRHPPEWALRDAKAMRLLEEMHRMNGWALVLGAGALPTATVVAVLGYVASR